MPNNPIHRLTNLPVNKEGFRKTRGRPNQEDEQNEEPKFIRDFQKDKLRTANAVFFTHRRARLEQKSIDLPTTVDFVEIHFFTRFTLDLQKKFFRLYGLEVISYRNFNKTVLFEIVDENLFRVFVAHIVAVIESPDGQEYKGKSYNLISLINTFEFYTSRSRIDVLAGEGCIVSLVPSVTEASVAQINFLKEYLFARGVDYSYSSEFPDLIEIRSLNFADIRELANNFDVIRLITSSHQIRLRPGIYGTVRRDWGFTVNIPENLPTVCIIDSGVNNIEPLRELLVGPYYDHTPYGINYDELGHGTMVAGLVVFGEELPASVLESYTAHAKISIIKTLHFDGDGLDLPKLLTDIKDANVKYGVRLFNMSLNLGTAKRYNQSFSDFAFELDMLAHDLDLLIIISAGNFNSDDLRELVSGGSQYHPSHDYPNFFYDLNSTSQNHSCWHTNIKEPAESLNNISVGALAGNIESDDHTDISPLAELPAYYTRKFHYDISQDLNGTPQSSRQHSKHLNKPDLVFDGGDLYSDLAGIEIISAPMATVGHFFGRTAGTSLAAPLVANYAARLMRSYPTLRMQSIKALIINNATLPAGKDPHIFRSSKINLYKKLVGHGKPSLTNLISTDDYTATFIIEDSIEIDEVKVIPIKLPPLVHRGGDKYHFSITLCYSFSPVYSNQLAYLPLQIAFGAFATLDAEKIANSNAEALRIKGGLSWSDDFFGVENRQFANTQKQEFNLSAKNVAEIGEVVGLAVRCTGKKEIPETDRRRLEEASHRFSIALTISEIPEAKASGSLFADLVALNNVQAINELDAEGTIEIEV